MSNELRPPTNGNWKSQVFVFGGIAGLIVGILAAYFYARASEETGTLGPSRIKTMDALKLAVALLSIVRQITDLGAGSSKN